jgi:hypothetical protein
MPVVKFAWSADLSQNEESIVQISGLTMKCSWTDVMTLALRYVLYNAHIIFLRIFHSNGGHSQLLTAD